MSYELVGESSDRGQGSRRNRNNRIPVDHDENGEHPLSLSSSLPELAAPFQRRTLPSLSEPLTAARQGEDGDDPFSVFREELLHQLALVDESLAEFLRVVHQTDTAVNTHEVKETKKQLKRHMKNAESTLRDVEMTVQAVEQDREKFRHVDEKELYDRRSLTQTSAERLNRARQESNSPAIKAKLLADERAKALRRAGAGVLGAQSDAQRQNTNYIIDSQAKTSLLMQHQDETLDELDAAVTRVGDMVSNIHAEIGQQNKMLNEMSDDLDRAEEELGLVMGKLAKLLQTKSSWEIGTILAMLGTVIVLLMLVIYT